MIFLIFRFFQIPILIKNLWKSKDSSPGTENKLWSSLWRFFALVKTQFRPVWAQIWSIFRPKIVRKLSQNSVKTQVVLVFIKIVIFRASNRAHEKVENISWLSCKISSNLVNFKSSLWAVEVWAVFSLKPPACVLIPTRSAHCVTGPPLRAPENCLPRLFHGGLVVMLVMVVVVVSRTRSKSHASRGNNV